MASHSSNTHRVCRFFTAPGGCRKGENCDFAHVQSGSASSSCSGQDTARPVGPRAQQSQPTSPDKSKSWRTNRPQIAQPRTVNTPSTFDPPTFDTTLIAAFNKNYCDLIFPSNGFPSNEAISRVQAYLHPNFSLSNGRTANSFGLILLSMRSWRSEKERQELVACIAERGLKTLLSILTWQRVSSRHSFNPETMSFQQGYVPVLMFLTSDAVLGTMLQRFTNRLYSAIELNLDKVLGTIKSCLLEMEKHKEIQPAQQRVGFKLASGVQVVRPVTLLLSTYLNIFREATTAHNEQLSNFVRFLADWTVEWSKWAASAADAWRNLTPDEQAYGRDCVLSSISKLATMIQGARAEIAPMQAAPVEAAAPVISLGELALMRRQFDPPGDLREGGPRHDNDFADIRRIKIAPTTAELQCRTPSFLPTTVPGAPHHLPEGSVERLFDTQFRLLRQEIIAPLQETLSALCEEFSAYVHATTAHTGQLQQLLTRGGGMYRGPNGSADLRAYGNGQVEFGEAHASNKGAALTISLPPAKGRQDFAKYWNSITRRALGYGALMAYVVQSPTDPVPRVFVGTLASFQASGPNINAQGKLSISVAFYDSAIFARAFQQPRPARQVDLLVEVTGVLMDTLEPFLRALQQTSQWPAFMPFARYLTLGTATTAVQVEPPSYARVPGFRFNLSGLLRPEAQVRNLYLVPTSEKSKEVARATLRTNGVLDLSQADAVVDSLTREVALIQGPPGTGKSFVGVRLVETLLKSGRKGILIICHTNHALDTFLSSLLDRGIRDIVRLGGRSKDPRIQGLALELLAQTHKREQSSAQRSAFRELRLAEEELVNTAKAARKSHVTSADIERHLAFEHPAQLDAINNPPPFVADLWDADHGWQQVGRRPIDNLLHFWLQGRDLQMHEEWLAVEASMKSSVPLVVEVDKPKNDKGKGKAVERNEEQRDNTDVPLGMLDRWAWQDEDDSESFEADAGSTQQDLQAVSGQAGSSTEAIQAAPMEAETTSWSLPPLPTSQRPVEELLEELDMWSFSKDERDRVRLAWRDQILLVATAELLRAREVYENARADWQEHRSEERLILAQGFEVVGCTTNGAAQLCLFLEKLKPSVLVVEEAGEVLEAHVLAATAPSLEHLILIGDPLQLRPHVSTYALSVENRLGGMTNKYRLDLSLMERLAQESKLPMSQIDVQRRMRPDFADLVRPLYRNLIDHKGCLGREDIKGMSKNLAFINHDHAESSGQWGGTSKINEFEVDMAVALSRHLVKQGYAHESQIAILVTYLGQLKRIRERLEEERITTIVDERDERELRKEEQGSASEDEDGDDAPQQEQRQTVKHISHTNLAGCVRLACVDNFQGEESKIVILSTVRNSGVDDSVEGFCPPTLRRSGIGFVKSTNRANVALSRARDGLFILGNATLLASQSAFWSTVVATLESKENIVDGVPLQCANHPEKALIARTAHEIVLFAADGGCSRPCGRALDCGHICDRKCHPGDPEHLMARCTQPCRRLHDSCRHPCTKRCFELCGDCTFTLAVVKLPCGHEAASVPCSKLTAGIIFCTSLVTKQLPACEHRAKMICSEDPAKHRCKATCAAKLPCCERACSSTCAACQELSRPSVQKVRFNEEGEEEEPEATIIERTKHVSHPCGRPYKACTHKCTSMCTVEHATSGCGACRQPCDATQCAHTKCTFACSEPCRICLEHCSWKACPHVAACIDSCGMPCSRVPCDEPCPNKLECGHPCPSVCGEPCEIQPCPQCADTLKQKDVMEGRTLAEIDVQSSELDQRIITLACGHAWTVETLDGTLELNSFYIKNGHWLAPAAPPSGFLERPRCPTCRGPITSPRYGRIVNRATLDHHEKALWATQMKEVESIQVSQRELKVDSSTTRLDTEVKQALKEQEGKAPNAFREREATLERVLRLAARFETALFLNGKLANATWWGGIHHKVASVWRRIAGPVLDLRERCQDICQVKSPHVKAWEATLSSAYTRARELYTDRDVRADQKAMAEARRAVAMPEPRAEQRVRIEAFMVALDLDLILVDMAGKLLTALTEQSKPQAAAFRWQVRLTIESGKQDAEKALALAGTGGYTQLALQAHAHKYRFQFEDIRFNSAIDMMSEKMKDELQHGGLLSRVTSSLQSAERDMRNSITRFLASGKSKDSEWYNQTSDSVDSISREGKDLIEAIKRRSPYQPVSIEERRQVIKAMGFTHGSHFYRCERGHSFVIDDCGGAMQTSTCPECGALIGGMHHQLAQGNTLDVEMERIARGEGVQRSPWNWAVQID